MCKNASVRLKTRLGLLACAPVLFLCAQALAQESVRSELIRLQKQTGLSLVSVRDNKIYTIRFSHRSLNELSPVPGKGTVMSGEFSDDGTKLAVAACKGRGIGQATGDHAECLGGSVLAIMRADGSDAHEYADLSNPGFGICWSHDSSKLVLVVRDMRKGKYAQEELQILDITTGETELIAYGPDFIDRQCWSPDDRQVVYTSDNMAVHAQVSIYDVELKSSRAFSKGSRPTWSPDGNWIALMDCPPSLWGCKYYAIRPTGRERKLLFKSEAATALWWSPDSRFVAYVNGAGAFERTPPQLLREMVRLRVRRLEDNAVDSFADFFDGDTMDFQWLKNGLTILPAAQSNLAP